MRNIVKRGSGERGEREKNIAGARPGSSMVELVIAIVVLGFVLLGIMSGVLIARSSVTYKEYENARQVGLMVLESIEAIRFDQIKTVGVSRYNNTSFGGFNIKVGARSTDISPDLMLVTVSLDMADSASRFNAMTLVREVSSSGWRNVGSTGD
ncbi:MAG: hypothetical protein LBT08_05115 [Synergistaceae bacterium]|jgi:type II secretory pathway pseudopilin PulG|nr:hypothetical protein [Synergistaceae bacterium]